MDRQDGLSPLSVQFLKNVERGGDRTGAGSGGVAGEQEEERGNDPEQRALQQLKKIDVVAAEELEKKD